MLDSADIERAVAALGFEVVQMERGGGPRRPLLRLRIDRPGLSPAHSGVTVDDCVAVTRELRGALEDGAAEDWVLEVSSPGVDRPLVKTADYVRFAGSRIRVRGYGPLAERGRKLEGTLLGTVDGRPGTFAMEVEGDRLEIPLEDVASARLVYDWDTGEGVDGR